jgi:hypothetical protein
VADDEKPDPRIPASYPGMRAALQNYFRQSTTQLANKRPESDLRRDIAAAVEQSDRPPEKANVSGEGRQPDLPGTKTLDYLGLGLLLATPAVVVDMYVRGSNIDWHKVTVAAVVSCLTGGFCVWASHRWQAWRTADNRLLPYLAAFESKFWGKAIIVAAAIALALGLRSFLSNEPPVGQGSFTQRQVDQKIAEAIAPLRAQIATLQASLDDMTRQRDTALKQRPAQSLPAQSIANGPIAWENNVAFYAGSGTATVGYMTLRGINTATSAAQLKSAFIISDITGERRPLLVNIPYGTLGGEKVSVDQINPIAPKARVQLTVEWHPLLSVADFVSQWGKFTIAIDYDGASFRWSLSNELIRNTLIRDIVGADAVLGVPRVTKKSSAK